MRSLTRLFAAAVVLAACTAGAGAKEWKTVKIATEGAFPPFNFIDSNKQLQGFDIDIGKALCEKAKVKCEFVAQDWDGIIPALLARKYDAILASMSITEERKKKIDFTDKYYNPPARFVTAKASGLKEVTSEALKGKTVGAQSTTTQANYLEDLYKPKGVTVKLYAKQDEVNAELAAGRIDALFADSTVLYNWLEKEAAGKCCIFIGPEFTEPKYFGDGAGIAVRKDKDSQDLKVLFNKALAEIIKDGTYEKINKKYFPFSIY